MFATTGPGQAPAETHQSGRQEEEQISLHKMLIAEGRRRFEYYREVMLMLDVNMNCAMRSEQDDLYASIHEIAYSDIDTCIQLYPLDFHVIVVPED